MLRHLLAVLMLLHGGIHLLGFMKAYNLAALPSLPLQISKREGLAWLIAAVFWIAASVLEYLDVEKRWLLVVPAILLSQILIFQHCQAARWGTIPHLILLLVMLFSATSRIFESGFRSAVKPLLIQAEDQHARILTEVDIRELPDPVQRYIRQSGAIGRPVPVSMVVKMTGRMRAKGKSFFPFDSQQCNDFEHPSRHFFMVADMFGLRVPGYHRFQQGKANMDIRLLGIFPIQQKDGPVMDTTETVTFLNDLCLMAPGAMVYPYLSWETIDSSTATVHMRYQGVHVSAELQFNQQGQLINFISRDRTEINSGQKLVFSTPVHSYQELQGGMILQDGDGMWQYPDENFVYGQFHLQSIHYNPRQEKLLPRFFKGF